MFSRRTFVSSALAAAVIGPVAANAQGYVVPPQHMPVYVNLTNANGWPPNELHLDPNTFHLYLTMPEGRAIRYSVGIGRPGLYEPGEFTVGAKKKWPAWTPTPEMIQRNPASYKQYEDGVPGGPDNPLGARALYLFKPQIGDTMLRIHGTGLPQTIGTRVSNGCARLINSHIVDLYERVPMGTRVVLYDVA